jgi:hypothetical protein
MYQLLQNVASVLQLEVLQLRKGSLANCLKLKGFGHMEIRTYGKWAGRRRQVDEGTGRRRQVTDLLVFSRKHPEARQGHAGPPKPFWAPSRRTGFVAAGGDAKRNRMSDITPIYFSEIL